MTRCVIFSQGPPPTADHAIVEGGGLRSWGLATGVKANDPELHVILAYHAHHRGSAADPAVWDGIEVRLWELGTIGQLIRDAESVIVSYCMGDLSLEIARQVAPNQQLVLDCYVPIAVEVSARKAADRAAEYAAFLEDEKRWNSVLERGDVFLCASRAQYDYYRGVLATLGRINPLTYGQQLIQVVPFGVSRAEPVASGQPVTAFLKRKDAKRLLWFGGSYPWFDARRLIEAVPLVNRSVACELVIVGGKNPFVRNADLDSAFARTRGHAAAPGLDGVVHIHDWVEYHDRADWYLDSDLLVMINAIGEENQLAWRTRLMDYLWAGAAVATNGGDPLGEQLIAEGAALRVDATSPEALAAGLAAALGNEQTLASLRANARRLREHFYWDLLTPELTATIQEHRRAADLTALHLSTTPVEMSRKARAVAQVQRALRDATYVYRYTRQFGVRSAAQLTRDVLRRRVKTSPRPSARGRLVMLAHYLDLSGAPLVLVDTAVDARAEWPDVPLALYAYPPVHSAHLLRMRRAGVPTQLLSSRDDPPPLEPADVLFMNTSMQSYPVRNHVYSRLEAGDLRAAVWYIHEDDPRRWFREDERRRIRDLLRQRRMKVLVAARQMLGRYREFFESESGVVLQPYNITIPDELTAAREASDFAEKLRFVLPGTMGDGRKGQLPVLYAFAAFLRLHLEPDPGAYREFELVLLGVEDDYLSEQLRHHEGSLNGRLRYHPKLPRDEALAIVAACNITLCYSLYECLPIFVFEGMLAGHPILRNSSSGVEEQLEDGRNGYLIESNDFWQLVGTIERVLNRSKTSDQTLAAMSSRSVEIAHEQQTPSRLAGIRQELENLSRHPTAVG